MINSRSLPIFVLLWFLGMSSLPALMPDTAFKTNIRSSMHSSLLAENPLYESYGFPNQDEGLSHPFASPDAFLHNLQAAFGLGEPNRSLLAYRHKASAFKADVNFVAGYEHNFLEDQDYRFWYKGWNLIAKAGDKLELCTRWYNGAYYGNLDIAESDELIDGYYKRFEKHIQLDNLNGYISYSSDDYSLALGRGRFQIAPSISGSIILNDRVNDYGYLLAEAKAGAFSLSFLHASLMADSTYSVYANGILDDRNYPDKFIALHQLNYRPSWKWNLYLGESVVYGNRSIDLGYVLPNSFWRAVEHNLWDRDNVLIYAGLEHRLNRQMTLYGQLALDEFSYGKIFSNWWGNKYALQGGINHQRSNSISTLELTAVRPYTYAHFQNHTMYSHDGRSLGYSEGSNVFNVSFENLCYLHSFLKWNVQLAFSYQGSQGSDWTENYHDTFAGQIDDAEVQWFAGEINREFSIANSITVLLFAHHKLLLGQQSNYVDDWQHRLFAAWQFTY